ncbi:hypothetical protein HUJ04_011323 [Dendroctonus ponderosae]|nr:hypothetical protein HUJ04_011323 [Dendroctonus ponderosae]
MKTLVSQEGSNGIYYRTELKTQRSIDSLSQTFLQQTDKCTLNPPCENKPIKTAWVVDLISDPGHFSCARPGGEHNTDHHQSPTCNRWEELNTNNKDVIIRQDNYFLIKTNQDDKATQLLQQLKQENMRVSLQHRSLLLAPNATLLNTGTKLGKHRLNERNALALIQLQFSVSRQVRCLQLGRAWRMERKVPEETNSTYQWYIMVYEIPDDNLSELGDVSEAEIVAEVENSGPLSSATDVFDIEAMPIIFDDERDSAESEEWSSEDEIPISVVKARELSKKTIWTKSVSNCLHILKDFCEDSGPNIDSEVESPTDMFLQLFPDRLLEHMVFQTNLYALQKSGGPSADKRKVLATIVQSIILYAASAWNGAVDIAHNKRRLPACQRMIALRCASAYHTVYANAILVITEQIPITMLVKDRL